MSKLEGEYIIIHQDAYLILLQQWAGGIPTGKLYRITAEAPAQTAIDATLNLEELVGKRS